MKRRQEQGAMGERRKRQRGKKELIESSKKIYYKREREREREQVKEK